MQYNAATNSCRSTDVVPHEQSRAEPCKFDVEDCVCELPVHCDKRASYPPFTRFNTLVFHACSQNTSMSCTVQQQNFTIVLYISFKLVAGKIDMIKDLCYGIETFSAMMTVFLLYKWCFRFLLSACARTGLSKKMCIVGWPPATKSARSSCSHQLTIAMINSFWLLYMAGQKVSSHIIHSSLGISPVLINTAGPHIRVR